MLSWWALGLAALAGLVMAIQGSINASLGKLAGLWEMIILVNVLGALAAGIVILSPLADQNLGRLLDAPWYLWLGGLGGVFIIYGVAKSIPEVGVTAATTAIIVAQLSGAAIIDHLGLFGLERVPFQPIKILGVVLMAGGAWVLLLRPS